MHDAFDEAAEETVFWFPSATQELCRHFYTTLRDRERELEVEDMQLEELGRLD